MNSSHYTLFRGIYIFSLNFHTSFFQFLTAPYPNPYLQGNMDIDVKFTPYSETGVPPSSIMLVDRKLKDGMTLKLGRQVIKDGEFQTKENMHGLDIWFSSKVVSRIHAEVWAKDGQVRQILRL